MLQLSKVSISKENVMIILHAYYLLYVSFSRPEMANKHLKIITKLAALLLKLVSWYYSMLWLHILVTSAFILSQCEVAL